MKSLDRIAPEAGVGTQYAALCYRFAAKGKVEVLLITSRDTGRWVIPKGWPIHSADAPGGAAQEAWEEAGVKGEVAGPCIGLYSYDKVAADGSLLPTIVAVFPIRVAKLAARWPEKSDRTRKWFTPAKAAKKVAEPELANLIAGFDPAALPAAQG
jgi:8-oxo-dGTP pyrophosphatase MutT (NUDIX family)